MTQVTDQHTGVSDSNSRAFDPVELEILWQSLISTVNEQARGWRLGVGGAKYVLVGGVIPILIVQPVGCVEMFFSVNSNTIAHTGTITVRKEICLG